MLMSFILHLRCSISCQTRPTATHGGSVQNLDQVMEMSFRSIRRPHFMSVRASSSSVFKAKTSRYHSLRISASSFRKALQVSEPKMECEKISGVFQPERNNSIDLGKNVLVLVATMSKSLQHSPFGRRKGWSLKPRGYRWYDWVVQNCCMHVEQVFI